MSAPSPAGSRPDAPPANRTTAAERLGLTAVAVAQLALRLAFWPRVRETGDALNYAIGALYTHVAHPPGSVGYCLLLGWVNLLVHDVKTTLILVSTVAGTAAVVLCHRVAKGVGMTAEAALAAAAVYGFSVATLQASLLGGPHELEGMLSLAFGLLGWRAAGGGRPGTGLLASGVFAVAGAVRPTTTLLLAPLWLYVVWAGRPAGDGRRPAVRLAGYVARHAAVVVPIVAAWSFGNAHYMTANGYGGRTYQDQVISAASYDYDNLATTAANVHPVSRSSFHMPGAELLAWAEVKTGLRLLPHTPDWPTPSLARAGRLLATQAAKQAWWVTVSLPLVWLVAGLALFVRGGLCRPPPAVTRYLALWVLPAVLFFIVGHLGTLTYVQVYLGGLCVWVVRLLLGPGPTTTAPAATRPAGARRLARAAVLATVVLDAAYFGLARPFQAQAGPKRIADLLALQFDGYSRRNGFSTSRNTGAVQTSAEAIDGPDHDYLAAATDAELLAAARRHRFMYAAFPDLAGRDAPPPTSAPAGPGAAAD